MQDKGFSPDWLVCVRLLIAGTILLIINRLQGGSPTFAIWKERHEALSLIAFSLFGMMAAQFTYFLSIYYGNAAAASVLQFLEPILIVIYLALRSRKPPTIREMLCVALAFLGTFLLVTRGSIDTLVVPPLALFWGLLSAFAAAFYIVQPKALLSHWSSPLVIGWAMLIGGLFLTPLARPWDFGGVLDVGSLLGFGYIVVFGTVIAFWSYLESIKYISPTMTGTLAALEPVSAVLFSALLLGLTLTLIEGLGGLLVLAAVTLLAKK